MLKTKTIFDHLSKHVNNVIEIFDSDTGKKIVSKINLEQITAINHDLDGYFEKLKVENNSVNTFGVQMYTANGSTHKRKGFPVMVIVNFAKKEMPKEEAEPGVSVATQTVVAPPVSHQYTNPFPANQGLMGSYGLSMPQVISLHTKAERYDDVKEQLFDTKDLLRKEREKNGLLTIDLRDAQSKLAVADQVKILAVQAQELNQKGLLDSPAVKELITQVGKLAPAILQAKGNIGLTGVSDEALSEEKIGLIDLIKDENFTDNVAMKLVYVAVGIQKVSLFEKELKILVEKHHIKNLINHGS